MRAVDAVTVPRVPSLRDVVALTKPRIVMLALVTAAGGMALAPGRPALGPWLLLLAGTGMLVASASALNMYLEREVDCLMARTADRPLPARRMDERIALLLGVVLALAAAPLLTFGLDPTTGLLGVVALISYVNLYTPLKQRTVAATLIGAVPGALPPLMGWTAATGGRIDAGGLALFAVLFFWQLPHFYAIALFRRKEYERAGLKTLPGERGSWRTWLAMVGYTAVQVAVTLVFPLLGVAGLPYLLVAAVLGTLYLGYAIAGGAALAGSDARGAGARWAKRFFLASILYLPLLFGALVLDGRQ
ncbi:MAG TPA: heme o synthase [Kofleriaceae bacterium]|nr:heme o synthase [Kofleriaceae bacterium]